MLRMVAGILVVATLVGVLMPARPAAEEGANGVEAAQPWFEGDSGSPTVATSSSASTSRGSGEVRLTRHGNGHFYADVEVNGTAIEFMIDTGATGIALTKADARRAGVRLDESDRTYVGEGAGGALTGHLVRLDRVKLGPRSSSGMSAAVIDGASTNLLGQSFLSQFDEVTVRGDVMILR